MKWIRVESLGISLLRQVIARWPADGLYRGVPQLTGIDPSLQHADSTIQALGCMAGCRSGYGSGTRLRSPTILRRRADRTADLPISEVGIIVRQVPLTFVTCIAALIRMPMNVDG
jgi:hypothetical protein